MIRKQEVSFKITWEELQDKFPELKEWRLERAILDVSGDKPAILIGVW